MMKKLSIIIPFNKYSDYLDECLLSLTKSTFNDFEVLIILDHPKEVLYDVLKKYEGILDIRIYELDKFHTGVAAARNAGIDLSRGEYLLFLDADDYLLENTLEKLMSIEANFDIAYANIIDTYQNFYNLLRVGNNLINDSNYYENLDNSFIKTLECAVNKEKELAIYNRFGRVDSLEKISCLGIIFNRQFILKNNFLFNESLKYYSDLCFLAPAFDKAVIIKHVTEANYMKRIHSDRYYKPQLDQLTEDRFDTRLSSIDYTRKLIKSDGTIRYYLDYQLVNYVLSDFVSKRIIKNDINFDYDKIIPFLNDLNTDVIDELSADKQKLLFAIRKNNYKKLRKVMKRYYNKNKIRMVKYMGNVVKPTSYKIYSKFSIKNDYILFETSDGKLSGNCKCIYDYIQKHYSDKYNCIFVGDNCGSNFKGKCVKKNSRQYYRYLATSKWLIFSGLQPAFFEKRKGQIIIEAWQDIPLKKIGFDQEQNSVDDEKDLLHKYSNNWDYLVSSNKFTTSIFREAFKYEGIILESGNPSVDFLFNVDRNEIKNKVRSELKVGSGRKVILLAPVKDEKIIEIDFEKLKNSLADRFAILFYNPDGAEIDFKEYKNFIYDVSNYENLNELILASDMLITNYSNIIYDFANTRRPMLLYTPDYDEYTSSFGEMYIDLKDEVPAPLLTSTDELIEAISNIDFINQQYSRKYQDFYAKFCSYNDGKASERVIETIFSNEEQ